MPVPLPFDAGEGMLPSSARSILPKLSPPDCDGVFRSVERAAIPAADIRLAVSIAALHEL